MSFTGLTRAASYSPDRATRSAGSSRFASAIISKIACSAV
jgi:hypothetical protein